LDRAQSAGLPPDVSRDLFGQVAGSFATGVTADTTGGLDNYHGMTASSFASLSLNPPLVLVCVDLNSSTLPVIEETKCFAINILGRDQEDISRTLAKPGKFGWHSDTVGYARRSIDRRQPCPLRNAGWHSDTWRVTT
jgi:flavin reductase (DIM6/NTAB) family NADH-FMN oxidoreductase RutF